MKGSLATFPEVAMDDSGGEEDAELNNEEEDGNGEEEAALASPESDLGLPGDSLGHFSGRSEL